jgi:hypothetical protein
LGHCASADERREGQRQGIVRDFTAIPGEERQTDLVEVPPLRANTRRHHDLTSDRPNVNFGLDAAALKKTGGALEKEARLQEGAMAFLMIPLNHDLLSVIVRLHPTAWMIGIPRSSPSR